MTYQYKKDKVFFIEPKLVEESDDIEKIDIGDLDKKYGGEIYDL